MIQKAGYSNPHTKTCTYSNDNNCKLKWDCIFIPTQKNIWYLLLSSCLWKKHYLANSSLILEEPIFQIFYLMNFKDCLTNYLMIFLNPVTAWWNLYFIKKWCMENQRDAHLKSMNPFPNFLARGRTNISDHHQYEMAKIFLVRKTSAELCQIQCSTYSSCVSFEL